MKLQDYGTVIMIELLGKASSSATFVAIVN